MNETKLTKVVNDETKKSIACFIVNNLGINLCSVRDIHVSRQKDGQIKNIQIVFIPSDVSENQKRVSEWRINNPHGSKMDCYRDTGISRPTINKYWEDKGE